MALVSDLHLHSKYSRAVSKNMVIEEMGTWAKIKGIDLLAIPDWTHSLWRKEARERLVETSKGIYSSKKDKKGPKFLLSTEISSIYSQDGDTRSLGSWTASVNFVGLLRSSEEKKHKKIRTKPNVGKANLAKTKLAKPKAGEKKKKTTLSNQNSGKTFPRYLSLLL